MGGTGILAAGAVVCSDTCSSSLGKKWNLTTEISLPASKRSIAAPTAAWAGASLATVTPSSLTIPAAAWNTPQVLTVQPSALADGTYHVTLQFS